MDLKEFISSGIIESYLLGTASSKDCEKVERMSMLHKEVNDIIWGYEKTLEEFDLLNSEQPPKNVKNKFMDYIDNLESENTTDSISTAVKNIYAVPKIWKIGAIAATFLLLISIGLNLFVISKHSSNKELTQKLASNQEKLITQNQQLKEIHEKTVHKFAFILNPDVKQFVLKGVNNHPSNLEATIYWNRQNGIVYLGKLNLPKPPKKKAYQLWAIINKKPVSLGMYNPTQDKILKKMQSLHTKKISAFAITLEKQAGSKVPTMNQLFVMGSVS